MSLKITNKASAKQIALLEKLGYDGRGKYEISNLTSEEAGKLIDELIIQNQWTYGQIDEHAHDYYNLPIQ